MDIFKTWAGFMRETDILLQKAKYGSNKFEVALPSFLDMYYVQMLSPLTVFQLFCAILWLLDSYWQYSVFNLFMVFAFEASVVFQRLKNLNSLKGMDNKESHLYIFRQEEWQLKSTVELVPGDIFSLVMFTSSSNNSSKNIDQDQDEKSTKNENETEEKKESVVSLVDSFV